MSNPSPTSNTAELLAAVLQFQSDRVKMAQFAKRSRWAGPGHRYQISEKQRADLWPEWWSILCQLAAASFAELLAAGLADPRVVAELKDAVLALHAVRVPPAFLHWDNASMAVDLTEQNHPGIRLRLFHEAMITFDVADTRVSRAVADIQELAALVPVTAPAGRRQPVTLDGISFPDPLTIGYGDRTATCDQTAVNVLRCVLTLRGGNEILVPESEVIEGLELSVLSTKNHRTKANAALESVGHPRRLSQITRKSDGAIFLRFEDIPAQE